MQYGEELQQEGQAQKSSSWGHGPLKSDFGHKSIEPFQTSSKMGRSIHNFSYCQT